MPHVTPNTPEVQYKTCSKCGVEKPISQFSKDKGKKDGFCVHCKACIAEYSRERYATNPEYFAKYYAENREHARQYRAARREHITEYCRQWRHANPEAVRAAKAARRARLHNAEGTHTAEDIHALVAGQTDRKGVLRCWHCGKPINGKYEIDHFVPVSKGGSNEIGNLRISCRSCNRHKSARMPWDFNGRLL